MAYTEQEAALDKVRDLALQLGAGIAFTQDHINYRMVGFWRGRPMLHGPDSRAIAMKRCVVGIGHTWAEAMAELERKQP